jgi:geranylgeranyl pyrophosphate synthase
LTEDELEELHAILDRTGAVQATRGTVDELAGGALAALEDVPIDADVAHALRWLVEAIASPEAAHPAG